MSEPERPHHPYSPSTLQALEACPVFKSVQSEHVRTIAGTLSHKVAETQIDDLALSDDDSVAVAECLDFYQQRKAVAELEGPVEELQECYLPIDDLKFDDCEATTAGYIDRGFITYGGRFAELFDWKFGSWPVEDAENNLQGIAYSLGLFKRYPRLREVEFWFKQPLINVLTSATFARAEVSKHYLRIQTVVARARRARREGNFLMANPTVPICSFCANLGKCDKVADFALRVAKKFNQLEFPDNLTPSQISNAKDTTLAMRLAQTLKVWSESYRRQVTERVLCGEANVPEGFKLQTSTKREFVDTGKFKTAALNFMSLDEYAATLEPTFGAVEKVISDKAPRGTKKATLETFQELTESSGAVKQSEPFSYLKAIPLTK